MMCPPTSPLFPYTTLFRSEPPPGPVIFQPGGSPRRATNQSRTNISSSVATGLVVHNIPCWPSAAVIISASTEGGDELAGKEANQHGCWQPGTPGKAIRLSADRSGAN